MIACSFAKFLRRKLAASGYDRGSFFRLSSSAEWTEAAARVVLLANDMRQFQCQC